MQVVFILQKLPLSLIHCVFKPIWQLVKKANDIGEQLRLQSAAPVCKSNNGVYLLKYKK